MKQPEKLKIRRKPRENEKKKKKNPKNQENTLKRKSSTLLNAPEVVNERRKGTNSYDSMEETADPNASNFRKLVGI